MFIRPDLVCAALAVAVVVAVPAAAAEPDDAMRDLARMYAALDARDQAGYCAAMHGAGYSGYLARVCQSAVQNRVKRPQDCAPARIARAAQVDADRCLAMPSTEFEATARRSDASRAKFLAALAAQGVDVERLMQELRQTRR